MTSAKKIRSNPANSLKSTGPSPENWWISSANSLKHGLFARRPVLSEKDRAVLEQFSKQIYAELQPVGPSETYYVEDFIDQMGRLRQSLKIETGLYELYRVYQGSQRDIGVAFVHECKSRRLPDAIDETLRPWL